MSKYNYLGVDADGAITRYENKPVWISDTYQWSQGRHGQVGRMGFGKTIPSDILDPIPGELYVKDPNETDWIRTYHNKNVNMDKYERILDHDKHYTRDYMGIDESGAVALYNFEPTWDVSNRAWKATKNNLDDRVSYKRDYTGAISVFKGVPLGSVYMRVTKWTKKAFPRGIFYDGYPWVLRASAVLDPIAYMYHTGEIKESV